jgi:hypothetical protein
MLLSATAMFTGKLGLAPWSRSWVRSMGRGRRFCRRRCRSACVKPSFISCIGARWAVAAAAIHGHRPNGGRTVRFMVQNDGPVCRFGVFDRVGVTLVRHAGRPPPPPNSARSDSLIYGTRPGPTMRLKSSSTAQREHGADTMLLVEIINFRNGPFIVRYRFAGGRLYSSGWSVERRFTPTPQHNVPETTATVGPRPIRHCHGAVNISFSRTAHF